MNSHGFARITCFSPVVAVGNPTANADHILSLLRKEGPDQPRFSDVVVFPELCITGYTCHDLFRQKALLDDAERAVDTIVHYTRSSGSGLIIVGAPVAVGNELFNCAVVINGGMILGVVPKQHIPNYNEFYESRHFRMADGTERKEVSYAFRDRIPFGIDLLFHDAEEKIVVGIEICEDLWMPIPPSSHAAIAGANVLVNLSASNETVGKNEYRTELVTNQSGRCIAAYAYASAGPTESTSDLVFGGHCLIAENGTLLGETGRIGDGNIEFGTRRVTKDVDVFKLQGERRLVTSFGDAKTFREKYRMVRFYRAGANDETLGLCRKVNGTPFIPKDTATLTKRCQEIFDIQCAGLAKRLMTMGWPDVYIGVSGGLDSTLALLVTHRVYQKFGQDVKKIHGITMPGFGTTDKTKGNATYLMDLLGISQESIPIDQLAFKSFETMDHSPFGIKLESPNPYLGSAVTWLVKQIAKLPQDVRDNGDLTFENVQARLRTFILMSKGLVIGTGDMSELALGWCTYNGDHMSMYNVNCTIPKTLVQFMVKYLSRVHGGELGDVLLDILGTTVSPELLPPGKDGEIVQATEGVLGPYELHDFFLHGFVRDGHDPKKLLFLARHAEFTKDYDDETIKKTLRTFIKRFFTQQYKRNCVPDGPKVGSVGLSPRGDWRMPSDADATLWLKEIEEVTR